MLTSQAAAMVMAAGKAVEVEAGPRKPSGEPCGCGLCGVWGEVSETELESRPETPAEKGSNAVPVPVCVTRRCVCGLAKW